MLAFITTESKTISLILNGKSYNIGTSRVEYPKIVSLIKQWKAEPDQRDPIEEEIDKLLSGNLPPLGGHAELRDGKVFYAEKEVNSNLAERIIQIDKMGLPPEPMLRFLENIFLNPSEDSREELYDFLSHKNIPITEDGHFLAYKAVRNNFLDKWTGTIDNSPGSVVEVPRDSVNDDRSMQCSHGLHVGALHYVRDYGSGYDDRFVIAKINPRDAVSVPLDHNAQKLRVCRYEVLMEVQRETVLDFPVYSSDGSQYDSLADFDYNEAWDQNREEEDEENERYLSNLWDDDEEKDETWSPAARNFFLSESQEKYDLEYDRDNICRLAFQRGIIQTIEAGRKMGKAAVCALLARADLDLEMNKL